MNSQGQHLNNQCVISLQANKGKTTLAAKRDTFMQKNHEELFILI